MSIIIVLIVSCTRASEKGLCHRTIVLGGFGTNTPVRGACWQFLGLLGQDRHIFTHKRAFRAGKRQIKAVHFFGHEKRAGYQYETTALYESI